MSDMLADGLAWLHRQRRSHMATLVTYQHRRQTKSVLATAAATQFEYNTDQGSIGAEQMDFLITAADLGWTPEAGDRIKYNSIAYEVLPFGQDGNGWRWSDSTRTTYRIHAKEIG